MSASVINESYYKNNKIFAETVHTRDSVFNQRSVPIS